ncbi:inorganic phosphate transporter [Blattabacterium cuenoti]|uniref:inorganic phosphate transporter n=1 Tax=Blattabacterium cuenoti TaxID=1653831 RepID=UPI00163BFFEE|nr:inorganic phosphate transporter [Blattabacterium cuenoti]
MEFFYPSVIIILFILSVFDLIVGLINDAVNFLNSAIGSKVSSRTTIMIFASIGIILGSILSSGMMDIARKGIFNPSYFYFSDIIFIFLAVMISDIILLDIFNTLGLPTSTTVSMVFCLLGGSFSIATIKILLNNKPFHYIIQYIKIYNILNISIGIFLSIIISFISGAVIHYFIRSLFSFNYKNKLKDIGVIWTAISLSSMTYFLIIRGLQNTIRGSFFIKITTFITYLISWINHNFFTFLIGLCLIWGGVAKIFISLGFNTLKFVVLYGTFALAMAFSGNDLVNFIGIPIAGIQSYDIWKKEGIGKPAEEFIMKNLSGNNVPVPYGILMISSIIMILTLWFSKRTNNITSTEINLSRQNEGPEKFLSNSFSRWIVRFFIYLGNIFKNFFPKKIFAYTEKNFRKTNIIIEKNEAFDLVRASANLTISSVLISIATVNKIPLSTTFVTFMVAMGTSLTDRAWDRESAVYRVSGVLNVIRGWLLTGLIAFMMAGIIASFLYFFKSWALLFLFFLIFFLFYRSYKNYSKIEFRKFEENKFFFDISNIDIENTINIILNILNPKIESTKIIYRNSIEGIINEDLKKLKNNRNKLLELINNFTGIDNSLIQVIRIIHKNDKNYGIFYFHMYNTIKEIMKSLDVITNYTLFHVINSHKPLRNKQKNNLLMLNNMIIKYFNSIKNINNNNDFYKKLDFFLNKMSNHIIENIEIQMNEQLIGISKNKYGTKNTFLMLNILSESKKITKYIKSIISLYNQYVFKIIKIKN